MNRHTNNIFLLLLIGLLTLAGFHSLAQTPDTWTSKTPFGGVARSGAVGFSIGNKGYIGTGLVGTNTRLKDFWEYDPQTNTWSQKADLGANTSIPAQTAAARAFASGFSIGTKGYIGCGDDNTLEHTSKDFWEYNPATNSWTKKADFGGVARRGAVGFTIGTKGYMGTGRYQGADHYKDIWEYDQIADTWTRKADLTGNPRAFAAAFGIGSKGYIGTGRDNSTFVKDFWEYNPATDTWTRKADFGGLTRYGAVGMSIGAYGYIGTGATPLPGGLSTDFWEYNPSTDSWTQKTNFSGTAKFLAVAFSIGNKGYIGTGQTDDNNYINTTDFRDYTPTCVAPSAPTVGTITQPICGTPTGSVELSGLPAGNWAVTITYPGGSTTTGTGSTATFPGLTAGNSVTTYTAAVTDASGCTSIASSPIDIIIYPGTLTLGKITGPTSVCSGSTGITYSIAPIAGMSGYSWSVTGTGWAITAGGSTSTATITIGTGIGTVNVSATNSCGSTASSSTGSITPSTDTPGTPLAITGPSSLCEFAIQDYSIAAVSGATSYTWSVSGPALYINSGQGTQNAAVTFVSPGNVSLSVKANNGCSSSSPSTLNLTVIPLARISSQPSNSSISYGSNTSFSIAATGGGLTYQWQVNPGTGFVDISPSAIYSNVTTATLNIALPPVSFTGYTYRCNVSGTCSTVTSKIAILTVNQTTLTWAGATSDWDVSSNWNPNQIPTIYTDVIIPNTSIEPTIVSNAQCKNLTINSGSLLTIAAGKSLTVIGTLTNNAGNSGLVIKSDATGTASLIHTNTGVGATVERYLSGNWSTPNSGWHFISSPVENQAISGFTTSGTGNGYDFYGWDEVSNLWINYKDAGFSTWNGGGTNFNIGQGYMVSYEATHVGIFSGSINVSNITKTNLTLSNGANYSWHLLSNPFSSALKWNDGNWALNNIASNAKIWNESAESYSDIAPGGTIPMEQGFMISINNAANSITIPATSRILSNSSWFKSNLNKYITLIASEQDSSSYQESKILINTAASREFSFDYDSRFLAGYAPQFYSLKGDEKLSTNSLPELNSADVIQFGFIKNQAENYKLELSETIPGQPVYLYDLKTDSIQDLSENAVYNFTSADGDDPVRFNLYFENLFTSLPDLNTKGDFSIAQSNGNFYIVASPNSNSEFRISNMLGQVVIQGKTNGNFRTPLNISNLPNGVYIVSMDCNKNIYSKKIVLNK